MENYATITERHPEMFECFFAFSNEQFAEGKKKAGIEDKKILSAGYGLFGTKEGIDKFLGYYDNRDKEIAEKCTPQEVYDFEFGNHECSYTNDDEEPIKIVIRIFGAEKAKEVKRRFAHFNIDSHE